jgi:hypothetical protein
VLIFSVVWKSFCGLFSNNQTAKSGCASASTVTVTSATVNAGGRAAIFSITAIYSGAGTVALPTAS